MMTGVSDAALRGELTMPGDKSISHRAVMFSALAEGDTHITGFLNGADCLSTIQCFERLGVPIELSENATEVTVHGRGMHGLRPENGETAVLDTGNSGTTTRILSGILAGQSFPSLLSGDASINRRPMRRIIEPLTAMGADIVSVNDNGCAPLHIAGSPLHGVEWTSPVASAQVKSCILCAGLYADGVTAVKEPALSRDHTERMLSAMGARVKTEKLCSSDKTVSYRTEITAAEKLTSPGIIEIPGDISSAAYFLVAGLIVPGSSILLRNVGINPTRAGILTVLRAMGGDITLMNRRDKTGEPSADILVRSSALHGTRICGDLIPTLIDEIPVLAVAAAAADGDTVIADAEELKVKESDRIAVCTENLRAMGAEVTPSEDGMTIAGGKPLHGALIRCHADHRIAMSFAVASLIAEGSVNLDDESCVRISYPGFFRDLTSLRR